MKLNVCEEHKTEREAWGLERTEREALKLASEASCARWECARVAGRFFFSCDQLPESLSRFAKINKDVIRLNVKLHKLITVVEYLFNKHCWSSNSFDLNLDDLISCETIFIFQCKEHANEAVEMLILYVILFYFK